MTTSPVATQLRLVVVPHTHWDREWYLPFEQFRRKLVQLVDSLFAIFATDPRYSHFMLDGQTVVLEDYLEIRPEREAALRALVASGRMAVGPWYVLPDEFLVSGEALVRNLQIGMGLARRFGRSMELGYLPDSFGHVAQMPQIFRGFGFESGCLWRGVGDDNPGAEWFWEALDGSRIYLQWLVNGYGNFANLPADAQAATERLEAEVARIGRLARAKTYLLLNGSDHLMPQAFLPDHLEAFRQAHPGWDVVQGTLEEAIARAREEAGELSVVRGELRQAADTSLLPGVLSARTYLKIANAGAQTLLERWVEPFSALAALEGRAYPTGLLRHAWKTLLKNHPHDSICGCSVDAVHRQMVARFESVEQLAGQLRGEAFAVLAGEDPDAELHREAGLRLYNPHPWSHVAAVEGELTLDCGPDEPPLFSLLDEEEQPVSYEILSQARGVRVVNRSPEYPVNVPVVKLRVRVVAAVPALGYRTLKIERAAGGTATHPELYVGNHWIENRFFKVRAVDGRVEIFDKALEETIVHHFEDAGDRGDEYNFCPVDGDPVLSSASWHWDVKEIVEAGSSLRMRLKATWALPGGLFEDRTTRVGLEPLDIALDVRLHAGVRRVEFETHVTNRSEDHRFRAAFRLPGPIAKTTADTAFGWVTRDSAVPEKAWAEKPMGTYPMVSQVVVERPTGSAGLSAVGLHEYEAADDTLYLTLVRAVGWLSREDLSTRKGDAGPMLAAPEAQCLDTFRFRYAWASQDADEATGTLRRLGAEFVVPGALGAIAAWQGPKEAMFLELDQPAWQMSALKVADAGDRLVLRLFNASSEPLSGTLTFGFPVKSVARARLDETPIEPAAVGADVLTTSLRGFEIATYLVEPATPLAIEPAPPSC